MTRDDIELPTPAQVASRVINQMANDLLAHSDCDQVDYADIVLIRATLSPAAKRLIRDLQTEGS